MQRFLNSDLISTLAVRSPMEAPAMRGEVPADIANLVTRAVGGDAEAGALFNAWASAQADIQRALTSSNVPVRENLDPLVNALVPGQTPFRDILTRVPGAGLATAWYTETTPGGGWGFSSTVPSGTANAVQTLGSNAGLKVGDSLYFAGVAQYRVITAVGSSNQVTLNATITTSNGEVVTKGPFFQPGGTAAVSRYFFAEQGAPVDRDRVVIRRTADYKILGSGMDITDFAASAAASFENQYAAMRVAAIRNLALMEEHSLLLSSGTDTAAPWGDGTTAFGYNGLWHSITTALGTPGDQIQTGVGALTKLHFDNQVNRVVSNGGQDLVAIVNMQEMQSLNTLYLSANAAAHINYQGGTANVTAGVAITDIVTASGVTVKLLVSRFMPAGSMIIAAMRDSQGQPTMMVDVLPQFQETDATQNVNGPLGYTLIDVARTKSAPLVKPYVACVFQAFKLKNQLTVARSIGVTPA